MATPREVAEWMLAEFEKTGRLFQDDAVKGIIAQFGVEHTYTNANSNPAINKDILKEWRAISKGKVQWDRSFPQCWERPTNPPAP